MSAADKLAGHAIGFLTLTVPVLAYFALFEASPLRGTPGRRLAGIFVAEREGGRAGLRRTLVRNGVKFLPWDVAHAAIWHQPGRPFIDPMPDINLAICLIALATALINLATIWTPSGRTLHDRIAGTRVMRA